MVNRFVSLLVLAVIALFASSGYPQHEYHPKDPKMRKKMMEKIRKLRGKLLRHRLGLDEQKARKVEHILDHAQEQRMKLHHGIRQQFEEAEKLLRIDSDDQTTYTKVVDKLLELKKALRDLRKKEVLALRSVLTPKQQVIFLIGMKKIRHKVKGEFWQTPGPTEP